VGVLLSEIQVFKTLEPDLRTEEQRNKLREHTDKRSDG